MGLFENKHIKSVMINGLLVAAALILSYVERMFPLALIIPIPGIKLGLANLATLFALFLLNFNSAFVIVVLRSILSSVLFGNLYSFIFSLSGGLTAMFAMALLKKYEGKQLSVFGISIAGAAMHNMGQIIVAAAVLQSSAVFPYLSLLMFSSIATGSLTGYAFMPIYNHFKKIGIKNLI